MSKKRPFTIRDSDDDGDADFEPKPEEDLVEEEFEEAAEAPSKPSTPRKVKGEKAIKASGSVALKNSEGETYFELGTKKRLTIGSWRKMTLIDIREYYTDKSGDPKPGKKGISLTEEQFQYVLDHASEIKKAIKAKSS
ncbi:hypothetical protein BGX34_007543 [Mortierella sp. NVP85]|nr:hypothetical protein BGX34_007543 [Mortierella sp. NVP85]